MKCEICLCEFNKSTESLLAVISPYLRILGEIKQRTSQLFFCDNCQGAFFSLRYSNAQMKLIYSDYRGDNYMKIRNHWERWYTFDYNEAHQEQAFIDERKQVIQKFLVEHEIINVNSVVDVGGDLGQFIPDFQQNTRKFVLDYSNRKLMNGISRIENLKDQANPDLIIYAHVLEHVSEPLKELATLLNFTKNVYVEVPYGIPESSLFRRSRILHLLAQFVSFFPKVWSFLTRPSAGRSVTASILRQSEHINFFLPETFLRIANNLGTECKVQVSYIPTPDRKTIRVLQVLLQRK